VQRNVECIFDETTDLRRKVAAKRTLEELYETRKTLDNILEALRCADQSELGALQTLVRNSASLTDISCHLESRISQVQLQRPLHDPRSEALVQARQQVQDLQGSGLGPDAIRKFRRLQPADPIVDVPAEPWTNVTNDNHLVSELISLFLTWLQPHLCHFVNRDLFLRDMKRGDLDCEFCSPFLVNGILAECCVSAECPPLPLIIKC